MVRFITQYLAEGSNTIGKLKYQDENVYINDTKYFADVPEVAWNFFGDYLPARKWLKNHKECG